MDWRLAGLLGWSRLLGSRQCFYTRCMAVCKIFRRCISTLRFLALKVRVARPLAGAEGNLAETSSAKQSSGPWLHVRWQEAAACFTQFLWGYSHPMSNSRKCFLCRCPRKLKQK